MPLGCCRSHVLGRAPEHLALAVAGPGQRASLLAAPAFSSTAIHRTRTGLQDAHAVLLAQQLIAFQYFGLEFVIIQKPKLVWAGGRGLLICLQFSLQTASANVSFICSLSVTIIKCQYLRWMLRIQNSAENVHLYHSVFFRKRKGASQLTCPT